MLLHRVCFRAPWDATHETCAENIDSNTRNSLYGSSGSEFEILGCLEVEQRPRLEKRMLTEKKNVACGASC
jgi:hypothetical protein